MRRGIGSVGAVAVILAVSLLDACASAAHSPSRSLDLITHEELVATRAQDVYAAVERIRPQWLRARATMNRAVDQVQVYLDRSHLGDVAALRRLPATSIQEIRFLGASDATTRYGTGNAAGILLVTTFKQ